MRRAGRFAFWFALALLATAADAACQGDAFSGGSSDDGARDGDADAGEAGSGDAGAGDAGAGEAGPDAPASKCPSGHGPMIDVGEFCIDATEVTAAAYTQFLDAGGLDAGAQPAVCSWNTAAVQGPQPLARDQHPMTDVDWCDAWAYCAWAGKRLCGQIGGGAMPYDTTRTNDATFDQWFFACSANGTRTYAYGESYVQGTCNDPNAGVGAPAVVGSFAKCEGGVAGLFDMNGNVNEWEDSCEAATGDADHCLIRSGGFGTAVEDQICAYDGNVPRGAHYPDLGIRCCWP